jgi:DNA-binding GntR family transcriptional regulator
LLTAIPAHSEAANDAALRGAPLAIYDWLLYRLEQHSYRKVNVSKTACAMGMSRTTVRVALRILCRRGYLQTTVTRTGTFAYRLLANRDPDLKERLTA